MLNKTKSYSNTQLTGKMGIKESSQIPKNNKWRDVFGKKTKPDSVQYSEYSVCYKYRYGCRAKR